MLTQLLPLHALSRLVGYLAYWRAGFLKTAFIRFFVQHYKVSLDEIENYNPQNYPSFNDFFTRYLKPGVRPIAEGAGVAVSPADGVVSEVGSIEADRLLQAKGSYYSLKDLLGNDGVMASLFSGGSFLTIYLSPKDYHRVHAPLAGQLKQMLHIPGKLFSVNQASVQSIPNLFARNERVVSLFETEVGPMAVILVGATCVGSIEMKWHGVVTPPTTRSVQQWSYHSQIIKLQRGDELGHFNMGSTVIVLFAKNAVRWAENLQANSVVKMGEAIGL